MNMIGTIKHLIPTASNSSRFENLDILCGLNAVCHFVTHETPSGQVRQKTVLNKRLQVNQKSTLM